MIVPASGHQVRCIPWVQMGTFNKEIGFLCGLKFFALKYFVGNTYNRVFIWCCKYGENRYCERCANKKLCTSKHTGLLNSCLGKLCLHPYLVVPLISARVTLISTRVSAHCQAILLWRDHVKVISNLLDIDFIQCNIHGRWSKKVMLWVSSMYDVCLYFFQRKYAEPFQIQGILPSCVP